MGPEQGAGDTPRGASLPREGSAPVQASCSSKTRGPGAPELRKASASAAPRGARRPRDMRRPEAAWTGQWGRLG